MDGLDAAKDYIGELRAPTPDDLLMLLELEKNLMTL